MKTAAISVAVNVHTFEITSQSSHALNWYSTARFSSPVYMYTATEGVGAGPSTQCMLVQLWECRVCFHPPAFELGCAMSLRGSRLPFP